MSDLPAIANNQSSSLENNSSALKEEQQSHEYDTAMDKEANTQAAPSPRKVHGIAAPARSSQTTSKIRTSWHGSPSGILSPTNWPSRLNILTDASSFMIGGVAAVLPFGKLYGLFNTKTLYIGSVTLFMVGSVICGAAPNIDAFIVGRVIAGAGGNGMYLGVMTLLSVTTTDKERPVYLSLVGLIFGIGTVIGPVIGGAFAESDATWRWGFYLNLCVGGLFAPVYLFLLPGFDPRGFDPKGPQKLAARFREFDYIGAVLSIATLVCIIMATNFGGTLYAWGNGRIIALFVLAGLFAVAFAVQQTLTVLTTESDHLVDINTSTAKIYGYEVLLGVGSGAYIQAGYGVIQAIIEPSNMSYAITFMML
ncbi:MAG: hypothetical protein Q9196_007218, partial [Gyalolechia fulgens]